MTLGWSRYVVHTHHSLTNLQQVKLWYLKVDYQLRLGQLVSIWTTLISSAEPSKSVSINIQNAPCTIDIFPERDSSCYFMLRADKDDETFSKTPFGYSRDKQLPGLMTLAGFVEGGHDTPTAKVLACVKSVGGRKKCMWTGSSIPAASSSFNANSHHEERRGRGCG